MSSKGKKKNREQEAHSNLLSFHRDAPPTFESLGWRSFPFVVSFEWSRERGRKRAEITVTTFYLSIIGNGH